MLPNGEFGPLASSSTILITVLLFLLISFIITPFVPITCTILSAGHITSPNLTPEEILARSIARLRESARRASAPSSLSPSSELGPLS